MQDLDKTYLIKFPIGALWGSGHGKKEEFLIASNLNISQLSGIHESCEAILGFKISDMCCDYGEDTLKTNISDILVKLKIITPEYAEISFEDTVYTSDLLDIWLSILKYLCPSFKYTLLDSTIDVMGKTCNPKTSHYIDIPGYGLFS